MRAPIVLTHMFNETYLVMSNLLRIKEWSYRDSMPKIKSIVMLFNGYASMFDKRYLYFVYE
jgi:hypothetical protein